MSIVFYVNLIESKSLIFLRRLAVMMKSDFCDGSLVRQCI